VRLAAPSSTFGTRGRRPPTRAIPFPDPDRLIGRRQVQRWVQSGVLRPGPGGYWLDETELARRGAMRRGVLVAVVLVLVVLLLVGVVALSARPRLLQ
jgi:hypothetical protein